MTRHSKNNCALGVFTYAEKSKLKGIYGTLESRVGRDSHKEFDSCCLCLTTAKQPLCCNQGHIYCKECIYASLLKQKQDIELEGKVVLNHKKSIERKKDLEIQNESDRKILDFINTEIKVTATSRLETGTTVDLQSSTSNSSFKIEKEKGSFWMPDKVANEKDNEMAIVKASPMCSAGKVPHQISLKKLVKVKFAESDGKKSCPVCVKGFSIGVEICVLKVCGHAICKGCSQKFILSSSSTSSASAKKEDGGKCPVCEGKCTAKQIVNLQVAGTGFAAKGGAEAKRETLAFQC